MIDFLPATCFYGIKIKNSPEEMVKKNTKMKKNLLGKSEKMKIS
jgi:hypothetical protein